MNFVFWGTDEFSVIVLDELKKAGLLPSLVVTATDKKMGRGMHLTPPPVKLWAEKHGIPLLQPDKLDDGFYLQLTTYDLQLFIVASYGKIIPKEVLDIPEPGSLNVHPSLLPKYRGASPIQSQIISEEKNIGVTIIKMDEKMDHGPILAKHKIESISSSSLSKEACPPSLRGGVSRRVSSLRDGGCFVRKYAELEKTLAKEGGRLLAEVIPKWVAGEIRPVVQNDTEASYTKKFAKNDGLIDLSADSKQNHLTILALS